MERGHGVLRSRKRRRQATDGGRRMSGFAEGFAHRPFVLYQAIGAAMASTGPRARALGPAPEFRNGVELHAAAVRVEITVRLGRGQPLPSEEPGFRAEPPRRDMERLIRTSPLRDSGGPPLAASSSLAGRRWESALPTARAWSSGRLRGGTLVAAPLAEPRNPGAVPGGDGTARYATTYTRHPARGPASASNGTRDQPGMAAIPACCLPGSR